MGQGLAYFGSFIMYLFLKAIGKDKKLSRKEVEDKYYLLNIFLGLGLFSVLYPLIKMIKNYM